MDIPVPLLEVVERVLIVLGLLVGVASLGLYALGGASPVVVPVALVLLLQSVHYLRERTAVAHGVGT